MTERVAILPWGKVRQFVLARDLWICTYCLDDADQVDHVIPMCQFGPHEISNLVAACGPCNRSKGGLTPEEWSARDGFPLPPWYYERRPS